jgi:vancomycin resistance protein YoaR
MSTVATVEPRVAVRGAPSPRGLFLGFFATLAAAFLLAIVAAAAVGWLNEGRILPGVRVGGISLAGENPASAAQRLRGSLPSLATGSATLVVNGEPTVVPYAEFGRAYDLTAMTQAAYTVGRSGNALADVLDRLRTMIGGIHQPLRAQATNQDRISAVATSFAARYSRAAIDATVTLQDGRFVVSPSENGLELAATTVRDRLATAAATPEVANATIELSPSVTRPAVTSEVARRAAELASQMAGAPLTLTNGKDAFVVTPDQIAALLTFSSEPERGFVPRVDSTAALARAAALAKLIDRAPANATYRFAATVEVLPAVPGRQLDQAATATAIAEAVERRASGGPASLEIPLAVTVTQPSLTTEMAAAAVSKIRRISTWTTYYVPGISNGYGVNISIPAQAINGKVIAPGATFDFWTEIGEVSFARGYRYGGAIIGGKSMPTGALAGGICSTSTTLFNTALRAGLEMHERWNHYYYISRYPVGLDATVYEDGGRAWSMSFRNDTPYPLVIRSYTGFGIVRFDLYGVPTGRTVTFTKPVIRNWVYGRNTTQYTTSLKPGVTRQIGDLHDGFDATVIRYVRDASGNVIHTDTYFSHYHAVNGVLLVGKAASTSTTP